MICGFIRSVRGADGLSIILHHMAKDERKRSSSRGISARKVDEPRVATRRIESAFLALGIITVLGVFGYMVFEGWSFADAVYMTVITLTTVGYREVRPLDTTGQLWTMLLLVTGGRHALLRGRLLRGARGGGHDTGLLRKEKDGGGDRKTERAPDPVRLRPGRPPGGGGVRPRRRTL